MTQRMHDGLASSHLTLRTLGTDQQWALGGTEVMKIDALAGDAACSNFSATLAPRRLERGAAGGRRRVLGVGGARVRVGEAVTVHSLRVKECLGLELQRSVLPTGDVSRTGTAGRRRAVAPLYASPSLACCVCLSVLFFEFVPPERFDTNGMLDMHLQGRA